MSVSFTSLFQEGLNPHMKSSIIKNVEYHHSEVKMIITNYGQYYCA
jgi:hypothetical protein